MSRTGGTREHRRILRMGLLALLWGSTFLWIELALTTLPPFQIVVARAALGAAALAVLARLAHQRLPRDVTTWRRLVVAALFCNTLPFALFALGQQSVDSGVAGVLNATTPLWSMVIGVLLGTDRPLAPVRLGGLVVGFLGVLLIFAPWRVGGLVSWGSVAILGAAASYAVAFAYMGRRLVDRGTGALAMSTAQLAVAAVLGCVALPFGHAGPARPTVTGLVAVVVLGVLCTGVTFVLNYRIIADEGATAAATVGYLLPVVSVGLGALVLHEEIGLRVVVGMVVVLLGVGLCRRRTPASRPAGSGCGTPGRGTEEDSGRATPYPIFTSIDTIR